MSFQSAIALALSRQDLVKQLIRANHLNREPARVPALNSECAGVGCGAGVGAGWLTGGAGGGVGVTCGCGAGGGVTGGGVTGVGTPPKIGRGPSPIA